MNNKNIIYSIFAGRKKYLSILKKYLDILLDKNLINEVHLWIFTNIEEDISYLNEISNNKYLLFYPNYDNTSSRWYPYYKYYYDNIDENTILIKSDDDIIYIDIECFSKFIDDITEDYVIYYPNIINNDVCAYFQTKNNIHSLFDYNIDENIIKSIGIPDPLTNWYKDFYKALEIHKLFLLNSDLLKFRDKELIDYGNRISINFFACNNKTIKKLFKRYLEYDFLDDEAYFGGEASIIQSNLNKINKINLNFTVVHFQFCTQNGLILDNLFLDKYNELANKIMLKYIVFGN